MTYGRFRQRNLLASFLAAVAATVVITALLPAELPQARPAAASCSLGGGFAGLFTPTPPAPTLSPPPTSPPSPTASPMPCPTPTDWPSATVPPTSPPPPGCPPLGEPPNYYERQLPLLDAANDIDATARGPVGPGYAGISIDVPECRVDVYWKGTLPPPVAAVVSIYDGPINVVEHEDAPYESAELEPQADRLVNDPALAEAAGIVLVRVGWPEEGTGVTAGVLATEPPPDLAAAESFLSQQLSVPVDLTIEEPFGLAARDDDRAPWYAGGRIRVEIARDRFGACSTGWAIRVGRDETHHMLTAAHCGTRADRVFNGDRSRQLGTLVDTNAALDSAIIDVTSGGGRMFTGRPTSNTSLPVQRTAEIEAGAWICDSGASTGQNCDIRVDGLNERIRTNIGFVRATTTTHRDRAGVAGGTGDSGGPVYIPVERDTRVRAVGIIVAIQSPVACRGDDDTTTCGRRMAFIPIGPILTQWNGTLITG